MVSKRNKRASELVKEFKAKLDELGFDYVICVEDFSAIHVKKSNVPLRQVAENYIQFRKDQERAEYTQRRVLEKLNDKYGWKELEKELEKAWIKRGIEP